MTSTYFTVFLAWISLNKEKKLRGRIIQSRWESIDKKNMPKDWEKYQMNNGWYFVISMTLYRKASPLVMQWNNMGDSGSVVGKLHSSPPVKRHWAWSITYWFVPSIVGVNDRALIRNIHNNYVRFPSQKKMAVLSHTRLFEYRNETSAHDWHFPSGNNNASVSGLFYSSLT